jgi:hypothetical protein
MKSWFEMSSHGHPIPMTGDAAQQSRDMVWAL